MYSIPKANGWILQWTKSRNSILFHSSRVQLSAGTGGNGFLFLSFLFIFIPSPLPFFLFPLHRSVCYGNCVCLDLYYSNFLIKFLQNLLSFYSRIHSIEIPGRILLLSHASLFYFLSICVILADKFQLPSGKCSPLFLFGICSIPWAVFHWCSRRRCSSRYSHRRQSPWYWLSILLLPS